MLSKFKSKPILFGIFSLIIFSLLEYFASYILEKLFHARWWDYSNKKFNLNGRICAETMFRFILLGYFTMYMLHPILYKFVSNISPTPLAIIAITILIIFIIDNIISLVLVLKYKVAEDNKEKDVTIEINKKIKSLFKKK